MDTELLIGGRLEKGAETAERILDPRTGELILELPEASAAQVDAAVAAAAGAFATWSRTTPAERSGYLLKIAERIEAEAEAFARLEALNCGKPINCALDDEMPAIVDCYRFFAGAVRCVSAVAAGEYMAGFTSMVRRDPIGVVASIAPWNYPLMMMAWKLAPAIGGGNTVVFKPSEQTPLTALKLAKIFAEILPEGVVNVIPGRGETVGAQLVNHPAVDMISLTGDVATGKKMLQAAAKSVKRTHLELGGKAPVVVFDDADIGEVVEGLRAFGYYNAGQDCTAACRVYASDKIYDRFVADLTAAAAAIRYAEADDTVNEIGPLISRRQRDRVSSFVERAREQPEHGTQARAQHPSRPRGRAAGAVIQAPGLRGGAVRPERPDDALGVAHGELARAVRRVVELHDDVRARGARAGAGRVGVAVRTDQERGLSGSRGRSQRERRGDHCQHRQHRQRPLTATHNPPHIQTPLPKWLQPYSPCRSYRPRSGIFGRVGGIVITHQG